MIYRIADFNFDLKGLYSWLESYCADYACPEADHADFVIRAKMSDIDYEAGLSGDAPAEAQLPLNRARYELLAVYRKICAAVLQKDGFLMHSAVIEYEGCGYMFAAQSGTGKTTHICLWKQLFGEDKVAVINGDKPILRFIDGKVYAYGTPWNGKEHYGVNRRTEVKGLCFLTRGEKNTIMRLSVEEAVPLLFSQIMVNDSTDLAAQLELADKLLSYVPAYLLRCNMQPEAAQVAFAGMQAGRKENDHA